MKLNAIIAASLLFLGSATALAAENRFELTISDHRFQPEVIKIPAGVKVTLVVHNKDNNYEEFHSDDLHREKIIGPNKTGIIHIGPLQPGTYGFMGEFHADTAQGRVIAE